jgi:hypothetical protein
VRVDFKHHIDAAVRDLRYQVWSAAQSRWLQFTRDELLLVDDFVVGRISYGRFVVGMIREHTRTRLRSFVRRVWSGK